MIRFRAAKVIVFYIDLPLQKATSTLHGNAAKIFAIWSCCCCERQLPWDTPNVHGTLSTALLRSAPPRWSWPCNPTPPPLSHLTDEI